MNIHDASAHNSVDIIRELINNGADVDQRDNYGTTFWNSLSVKDYFLYTVSELFQDTFNGQDYFVSSSQDHRNYHGCTPLHSAVRPGHFEAVKELIKHGANVNVTNDFGSTPLHMASRQGLSEIVQILLEYSDHSLRDIKGRTASDIALNQEIRDLIINYQEYPNIKDPGYN
jgi:ankyrin repeat protein